MEVGPAHFEGTPEEIANEIQALRDLCPLGADRYSGGPPNLVFTYDFAYVGEPTPTTAKVTLWGYVHSEDNQPNPPLRPTVRESVLGAIGQEARKYRASLGTVSATEAPQEPPTHEKPWDPDAYEFT